MEGQQQAALQVSVGDETASNINTCHKQRGLDCEQDENNSRQKTTEDWSCSLMKGASIQPPACAWSWEPSHAGGINQHYQSRWSWSPVSSFQRRYAGRWSWSPTQLKILPYSTQGEDSAASTPSESPATTVNCWPIFVNMCRSKRKRKRCRKRGRPLKYRPYSSKGERKWRHLTSVTELVQGTETKKLMFQDETMSARHVSHDIKHRTFTSCATEMKFLNSQARKHSGLLYTREGIVGEIEKSSNTASTVDGMLGKIESPRSEAEVKGNIKFYSKNNDNIQSKSPHCEGRRLVLGSHDEIIGATENSVSTIQVHEVVQLPTKNQHPLTEFDNTGKLHEEITMPPSKVNEANEGETESTLPTSEVHITKTAQINNLFVPKIRGTEFQKVRLLEMNEVNDGRTKSSSPKLKIEEVGNIQTDRSTPYDTDEKTEVQDESSCHLSSPRRDDIMPTEQPLDSPSQESQTGKSQGKEILWTEKNKTLLLSTNATTNDEVTEHLFTDREIAKGGTHSPSPAIAFERTRHGRCSRSPSPVDKLISGGIERSFSLELPHVPGAVAMSAEGFCEAKHLQSTTSSWPQDMLTVRPRRTYEFQSSNDNSQSESLLSLMDSVKSGNRTSLSPEKNLSENPSCKYNIATQLCGVPLLEKNVTEGDSTVNTFHLTGDGGMVTSVRKGSVNLFPSQTVQGSSSNWQISTTIEGETGESQDTRETAEDCTSQSTLRRTRTLTLPSPLIYSDSNISMVNRTESLHPVYERLDYKDNEKRKSFVVNELELVSTRSDASSVSNGENTGVLQKDPHLHIGPKYTSEGKSHQEIMVNYNEGLSVKYNVSESQGQIQEKNTSVVQTGITRPSEITLSSHKRDKCFSLEGVSGRPKSPSSADESSLQRSSSPSLAEEPSLQGSRSPSPAEEPRQGSRSPSPANEPYVQEFSSPSPAEKPRQRFTSPSLAERPSLLGSGIPSPSEDSSLGFGNPLISEEPLLQGPISPSTAEEPSLQGFSSPSPAEEPRQGFRSLSPAEELSLKGSSSPFPAEKGFRSLSSAEKSFLRGSRSPSPAEKHRQGFKSPSPAEEPSHQGSRSPSLIEEFSLHEFSSTFSAEEPFLQGSRSPSHLGEPQQGSRSPSLVEKPRQGSISPSPAEELQQISCSPSPAEEPLLQGSSTPSPAEEPRQGFGSPTVAKKHSLQGSSTPSSAEEPRQGFSSPLAEQLSLQGSSSSIPAEELQQGSRSPSSAEGSSLQGSSSPSLAEESQQGFKSLSPAEDLSLQGSRSSSLSEEPRQGSSGPSPIEKSSLQRSSSPYLGEEPSLQGSSSPFSAEEPRQGSISSFPAEELRQVSSSSSFAEESSLQGSSTPSSAEEPRQGFRSSSVVEEPSLQGFSSSFPAEELRQGTRSPSSAEIPSLQESSSPSLAEEARQWFKSPSPAEEHSLQGSRSPSLAGEPRQGSRSPSPAEELLLQGPRSVSPAGEPSLQRSTSPSPADEPQQMSRNPFPNEEPSLEGSSSPFPVDELSLQGSSSPSPAEKSSLQESRSPSPAEEPSLHGSRSASSVEEPSRREFNCPYLFEGRSPPVPTSPRSLGYTDSVAGDGNVAYPLGDEASGVTGTQRAWCSFPAVLKQASPLPQGETDNEPACKASFSDSTTLFVNEYSCDRGASGVKRKRSADFAADQPAADQADILKNILTEILEAQTSQRGAHRLRMVTRAVSRRLARRSPNHNLQHVAAARMEIFDAVESGKFERMRELLQDTGPGVRHGNTHCTLLHAAVERQQVDMVLFLLKVISPNVVNKDGRTPAHLAARNGHTQVLKLLLTDPQIDPDKRDNSNKTYKQWLALPLLEAVLKDNRGKVQELLRLGADPDCAVESLSEGQAARELHVTTARQLAHALHRDALLPLLKRKRIEDNSEDDEPGVSTQIMMLQREHRGREKEIKLCIDASPVEICENDVYKMEAAPRGYVCLLSYVSFKGRPDLQLEGSETDAHNLANVFSKMGYNGHAHFSLTAKQTRQQLATLRDNKMLEQAGCAIFVISSHGSSRRHFLTSDMQTIDVQWMLDFFKDSQCPSLKNKPKIFIWNLCRGHLQEESGRGDSQGGVCGRVDEPLRDVMCLEANGGSFSWHSFSEDGTPFIGALCRTLARHAATKELTQLYRDFLQEYAHVAPDAVPQLTNHGFNKRFYFNPDIKYCIS